MADAIKREFIPSLREGIDVVRMIFFKEMKQSLLLKYSDKGSEFSGMLAAAMMNELFATPNPQEKFALFAQENKERIQGELKKMAVEKQELCILLTDALRMHFLCNHQEGIDQGGEDMLAKAKEFGILLEERDVPLPKGFMELVYKVGKAHGLVVEQKM